MNFPILRRVFLMLFTLTLLLVAVFWLEIALQHPKLPNGWIQALLHFIYQLLQGEFQIGDQSPLQLQPLLLHFSATLELFCITLFVTILIAFPIAISAAVSNHRNYKKGVEVLCLFGNSLPVFWIALLVLMLAATYPDSLPLFGSVGLLYPIVPVTGSQLVDILLSDSPSKIDAFYSALEHLMLPVLVLSIPVTCELIRILQESVEQVQQRGYIQVAQARGMRPLPLMLRHGFRNALPPVIPEISLLVGSLMSSAMIIEIIFNRPGMGRWLLHNIQLQDYATFSAGLLLVCGFIILFGAILDLGSTLLFPAWRLVAYEAFK